MRYIKTASEGAKEAIVYLLLQKHVWLICCSAKDPDDFILENVCRYETEGQFASRFQTPVFIEYGISPSADNGFPYRIHDSLMQPIINGENFNNIIEAMLRTFDAVVIEEGMVNRTQVYGKLGTDHSEEIVFINDDER